MYGLREIKVLYAVLILSDTVNSLSNILTFLLSYTELITLTALELAIGFPEAFCYLFF